MIYDHEPWMDEGACRKDNHDPDWWFSSDTTVIRHAKAICATECDVAAQCLDWALRTKHKLGTAGGRTVEERRAIRHV